MEDINIIAIEIGSSHIKGAYGTYSLQQGTLTVNAVEEEPLLDWVRYGAVSNIEETSKLVMRVIRKLENRMAPRKVRSVHVAVGGRSCGTSARTVEQTMSEETEITSEILSSLIRQSSTSPYTDRDLLKVHPRQYYIDNVKVEHPKGTVGRKVRMDASLITLRTATTRNLRRLFDEKLHIDIDSMVVRHTAIADAVLTTDERRMGCMLVDFGAETTTVSIYKHGRLQYMATLPMGSRNITRDITHLNYLEEKAEELKRTVGQADNTAVMTSRHMDGIDYTGVNNYVNRRAGEIIANIKKQITYAGYKIEDLAAGIVVTGRGALLTGFNESLSEATALKLRTAAVNLHDVRIADSRISPSDAVDVISVLYAATRSADNLRDCLSSETPELTPTAEAVSEAPETVVIPEQPTHKPEPEIVIATEHGRSSTPSGAKMKNWIVKAMNHVNNMLSENPHDADDDDDLRDDEF